MLNEIGLIKIAGILVYLTLYFYLITGFAEIIYCAIHKFKPAYGILFSTLFPVMAAVFILLINIGILPYTPAINYAFPIGYLFELPLLLYFTVFYLRKRTRFQLVQELRFSHHKQYLKTLQIAVGEINTKADVQLALSLITKPNFSVEVLEADFEKLKKVITQSKRFTDSELTLQTLAKEVGINFPRASKAVNIVGNKNFSEWLNELRVNEAKSLLKSDASQKYTLEAIALMCGFGSRSNFHRVFKDVTGYSPGDFKNQ
jgi:AraC-like DNA-binding protein